MAASSQVEGGPGKIIIDVEHMIDPIEQAQQHIAQIRRSKGLDSGVLDEDLGSNVKDLTAALEVLSDQLYTQPTHFLLEFIQNADDNTYADGVLPTLKFHSLCGTLNISSNEIGFQPKNVEAICRIASSTKKDRSKGFIGEKGIGFKSVFKIASMVHISSQAYSFRFDRSGPLGMIAPIWCDFPGKIKDGNTQFLLQLSREKLDQSERELRTQLKKLDSTLLLFLRNLKQISVCIDDGSQTVEGKFTKDICRNDSEEYAGEMVRIHGDRKRVRKLVEDTDYLVVRHTATDMPSESRRRGMASSEVMLAFPFKNGKPTFFKQKAYAFLPVRESGFKFLLQGDFILIANREDVEGYNDWNQALLNALADCFVMAVSRFNHLDALTLRYTWLGFLRDMPSPDSNNFSDLGEQIFTRLTYQHVLENQLGEFIQPLQAVFVPAKFRDHRDRFLLDETTNGTTEGTAVVTKRCYISVHYEQHDPDHAVLKRLGVEIMDFPHFFGHLRKFMVDDFTSYTNKPAKWHSQLAQILMDMADEAQMYSLPLIPLRDGRWVRGVDAQCYFETTDSTVYSKLPEGIKELLLVDSSVLQELLRVKLLRQLGIKELTRGEVCRLLINLHHNPDAPDLPLDAMISHARYLYEVSRAGEHVAKPKQFWVHDIAGNARVAASTYCDPVDATLPIISSLLPAAQWSSYLLHPAYAKEYKGKLLEKWLKWLESWLDIRNLLRIADAQSRLTSEFRYIVGNCASGQMLDVLVATWAKESAALESKIIKDILGSIQVVCEDGASVRLSRTCIPNARLKAVAVEGLSFLRLNNPEAAKWKRLKEIGVVVKADLEFYLRCLSLTQGTAVAIPTIAALYKEVENHMHENFARVGDYFQTNAVIFIPGKNLWLTKSACVWDPTPGVSDEHALSAIYPMLQSFFFGHLKIRSATIEKVIDQLRNISMPNRDDSKLRKPLLFSLSDFLRKSPHDHVKLQQLENVPVMPIAPKFGLDGRRLASLNKPTWLFCDTYEYYKAFKNIEKILFADFDVEQFPRLEALCKAIAKAWDLDSERCLSRLVTEEWDASKQITFSPELTALLRSKLQFLRRLVRVNGGSHSEIKRKLDQLHYSRVSNAPQMAYRTYLSQGQLGKPIEGDCIQRDALHKTISGEVNFYLRSGADQYSLRMSLADEFCSYSGISQERLRLIAQKIICTDDPHRIYDLLVKCNVAGFEQQEYIPLAVQSLGILPTLVSPRQPLAVISGNVPQEQTLVTQGATLCTESGPVERFDSPNASLEALIPEVGEAVSVERTFTVQGASFAPDRELISRRSAIQAARLRESTAVVCIGGVPVTEAKKHGRPSDAENYCSIYESKSTARPIIACGGRTASGLQMRSPRPKRNSPPPIVAPFPCRDSKIKSDDELRREQKIGIKGELMVWNVLKDIFGEELDHSCWTSELRSLAGLSLPKWRPDDPSLTYGDFTVGDFGGLFTDWLSKNGISVPDFIANCSRTYHVEVKSTVGPEMEPFHMSRLQMKRCEELSGHTDEIFLIFRLYEIDTGSGGICIYADPWAALEQGLLKREAESWLVQ